VFAVLIAIIAVPVGLSRQTNRIRYENLDIAQPAMRLTEQVMSAFSNELADIDDFQATSVLSYSYEYRENEKLLDTALQALQPLAWSLGTDVFEDYLKVHDSVRQWHDSVAQENLAAKQLLAPRFREALFSEDSGIRAVNESLIDLQKHIAAGVYARRSRLYEIERAGSLATGVLSLFGVMALAIVAVFARSLHAGLREAERGRHEAQQATAARDEILRIVSHDLKNPVNVIAMASQQLSRDALPTQERSYLQEMIERSIRRIDGLIQALLDVGKIGAGRPLVLERGEYDVRGLVSEAVETARFTASRKSIKLICDVKGEVPTANVDRQRILQVLSNLIDNSIKFTPEGGTVTVSCTSAIDDVTLAISDTGGGISESDQQRIFDTYWHAKRTSGGGTGLGLAIVKRIVEEHGGTISVRSKVGAGSTFIVQLPRRSREKLREAS